MARSEAKREWDRRHKLRVGHGHRKYGWRVPDRVVEQMIAKRLEGWPVHEVADHFGVSYGTVVRRTSGALRDGAS